jgi:hypothetical protein
MKKFIAFCIFMIGLFIALPSTSSGSGLPPDQVCFLGDVGHADYIAIAQNAVQYQSYELFAVKPPIECVADGVIKKAPDIYAMYALNYRTCLDLTAIRGKNKLNTKNWVSYGVIRIRDDTSLV